MWKSGSYRRLSISAGKVNQSAAYQTVGSSRMTANRLSVSSYQQPPTPKSTEIVQTSSRNPSVVNVASDAELVQEAQFLKLPPNNYGRRVKTAELVKVVDDQPLQQKVSSASIYKPTESATLSRNSSMYSLKASGPASIKSSKSVNSSNSTGKLGGLSQNVKAKSVTIDGSSNSIVGSQKSLKGAKGSKGIGKVTGTAGAFFAFDMLDGQAGNDDPSNNPQKYTGETLQERRNKMEEANAQYWSDIANNWSYPESVRKDAQDMLDSLLAERVTS